MVYQSSSSSNKVKGGTDGGKDGNTGSSLIQLMMGYNDESDSDSDNELDAANNLDSIQKRTNSAERLPPQPRP